MHSWFRFYHEVVDDPKVQTLTPYQFRTWVNLLCIAAKHDGQLPDMRSISYRLHLSEKRAKAMIDELVELRLFEFVDGVIRPHKWADRQFNSDGSAERMRRWRERHSDGKVTSQVTRHKLRYTDTDTDTEQKPPIAPQGFDEFWKNYPQKRRKAKQAALKAWKRIKPTKDRCAAIYAAIEAQKLSEDWQKDDGQFIPYPATWLNQGRWEDEITKPLSLEEREKLGEEHWKTVKANR